MEDTPRGTKRKSTHSSEKKSKKRSKHTEESQTNGGYEAEVATPAVTEPVEEIGSVSQPERTKKSKKSKKDKATTTQSRSEKNTTSKSTPFTTVRASMFVTIPPILQGNAHQAVCANQLSPLLGLYYPEFQGTILAYNNVSFPGQQTSQSGDQSNGRYILAQSISESALPQLWISADFLVFQPKIGSVMEGFVNVQEDGFLNMVVYNWFSASISKRRLPKDWTWVEDDQEEEQTEAMDVDGENGTTMKKRKKRRGEGHWEDASGTNVAELGALSFRVINVEPPFVRDERDRQIMSITGSFLSAEEEAEMDEEMEERAQSMSRRTASLVPVPRSILKKGRSRETAVEA